MSENIEQLMANLRQAQGNVRAAQQKTADANRAETEAVNLCNLAQKAVEAKMIELQKEAPRGTDWHSRAHRGQRVEA